jgi:hypothetical protein
MKHDIGQMHPHNGLKPFGMGEIPIAFVKLCLAADQEEGFAVRL